MGKSGNRWVRVGTCRTKSAKDKPGGSTWKQVGNNGNKWEQVAALRNLSEKNWKKWEHVGKMKKRWNRWEHFGIGCKKWEHVGKKGKK